MSDLIDRQAAIDAIKIYWKRVIDDIPKDIGFEEMAKRCDLALEHNSGILKAINNLPSAQPETHEERTETHACDYISRQGAIDHFKSITVATSIGNKYNEGFVDGLNFAIGHLKTMPSVQPDVPDTNVGDMISRQGAMDGGSGK